MAALEDGGAEGGVLGVREDEGVDGHGTGGLASECHLLGVAAEGEYVALHPVEGQALVVEAKVLGFLWDLGRVGEAEN